MSSSLLVRSANEYARLLGFLRQPKSYEVVLLEPSLPAVARGAARRPGVVLWAPERTADER